ncbi:ABC transporter ATP-binding protein/permease [Luteibacter aegosomaticola]|uniref:ABC transporter ATP-binding protein n=1 Tax=Luteibacter aegosomaticola TaxID=2911538 RepID=UPI001FF84A97|nr:ATP-binding cassette domain-containing protein [Luteibacter aegosomaticola]UPG92359.1 ABC transporter ATP-binding protein/permease [Luteibacter aegosomaticola]
MLVDAGAAAGFARLVQPMIDDTFSASPSVSVWRVASMVVCVLALRSVAGFVGDVGMAYVGRLTVRDVRDEVFSAQLTSSEATESSDTVGDRVASVAYAVEQLAFSVTDALKIAILDGFTSVFCLCVMFYLSPVLAATMIGMIPVLVLVAICSGRFIRSLSSAYQQKVSEANTVVVEAWSSSRYIRIFGAFSVVRSRFSTCSSSLAEVGMRLSRVSSAASALTQLAGGISLALVIVVASGAEVPGGARVSAGTFFSVITAMGIALPSMRRLSGVYASLQRAFVSAGMIRDALARSGGDSSQGAHLNAGRVDIEFDSVSLRYEGAEALADVSFRCSAGTLTLLVGESGSGKSSLLSLISGFRSPSEGVVRLNGLPFSDYSTESVFGATTWVGSDTVLMSGTVRENIAFGELSDACLDDVILSARMASAWDFISCLPDGIDTALGAGGRELSEGQKQRILIARAMMKTTASIVLLDEATSALDRPTERAVGQGLLSVFRGRTILMASHRLDLAEQADQILVMERGRIVEAGKHHELLARRSSYWKLVEQAPRGATASAHS